MTHCIAILYYNMWYLINEFFVHSEIHYFHCIFVVLTYACYVKLMRLTWLKYKATNLTVIRPRVFVILAGIECSQMGTLGGLRLNKQYNLDTFFL